MADWYYMKDGQKCGPVDTAALKHLAETGEFQPEDMIRREGMPNWVPASQEKGLFEGGVLTAPAGQGPAATPITPLMAQHLLATRPWVLFLSILAFIGCGLLVAAGLGMIAVGGLSLGGGGDFFTRGRPLPWIVQGVTYLAMALVMGGLYAAPAWLLCSYAAAIKRYRYSGRSGDMEAALRIQKSFWKFVGIMTIFVLALCLVVLLVGVVVDIRLHR